MAPTDGTNMPSRRVWQLLAIDGIRPAGCDFDCTSSTVREPVRHLKRGSPNKASHARRRDMSGVLNQACGSVDVVRERANDTCIGGTDRYTASTATLGTERYSTSLPESHTAWNTHM
jgi:hypothetical protein